MYYWGLAMPPRALWREWSTCFSHLVFQQVSDIVLAHANWERGCFSYLAHKNLCLLFYALLSPKNFCVHQTIPPTIIMLSGWYSVLFYYFIPLTNSYNLLTPKILRTEAFKHFSGKRYYIYMHQTSHTVSTHHDLYYFKCARQVWHNTPRNSCYLSI